MENLINRIIFHPLVAMWTIHLTDLMANADNSLAAGAFALACTLSLRLTKALHRIACTQHRTER